MFRKFLTFVFIISIVTQWKISWGENYNFRYTRWGMTEEEVMATEKNGPMAIEKNKNMIKYKIQILGKNFVLIYLFVQNKLIGSLYKLDEKYLNSEHFIQTYIELKKELMIKYGQPNRETTNWLNDTYRNARNKWGLALSLGHFEYITLWETQNTTIECSLRAENYNVLCLVEYWSVEYSHLSKEINKEDKLDPF
jgi:hypothetical protein